MKTFPLLIVVLTLAAGRAPAATAYEALQVVKQSRGEAALKQLVEVRGETGQPQPQSWTILMIDPTARGGVREFVVVGKEIASERTPVRGTVEIGTLAALDFARLNLDSDGAFKLANQQAAELKLGFHSVDYTLRTNPDGGAPAWVLHLFDYMGAPVGNLKISAENGKIVRSLQVDPDSRQQAVVSTRNAVPPPATTRPEPSTYFKGGVFGFVERTAKNVGTATRDLGVNVGTTVRDTSVNIGSTVKKTTLNAAGSVQEVLTGDRTIGTPTPTPVPISAPGR